MRKILIVVVAFFVSVSLNAQVFLIDDFTLSATEGAYGIYADIDCDGSNVFYFDMHAPNDQQHVQMKLWGTYMEGFVQSLQSARLEYEKWTKIAQENNVTSLSKEINVPFSDKVMYFTENGKWYEEKGVDLKCKFMVSPGGSCYMVLQSDYMTSDEVVAHGYSIGNAYNAKSGRWSMAFASSTASITRYCSGASLTFSSTEEIDSFIQKLYDAQQWKKRNKEQGELFKDEIVIPFGGGRKK